MAEPFTIYKLTILNMLDKVDFPLTNTQISDFFLEQEYTDYFRVQQVLNDLADSGLIRTESTHSNTQYYITAVLLCDGGDLRAPKRHAGTGRSYHAAHIEFT